MAQTFQADSFEIANAAIEVKYGKGDAVALRAMCEQWFVRFPKQDVYAAYEGNRMLPSQLDLWELAAQRVRCAAVARR